MAIEFTFRKKIILSQIILFIIFFAALFPFVEKMASLLVRDSLIDTTSELKARLQKAGTEEELIRSLQNQQYYSFFRMSIINDKGLVIYDTHLKRLLGSKFEPYYPTEQSEVDEALKKGKGYTIATSDTFGGQFAYVAETFKFQDKTYVLRTAFPYDQIKDLTHTFKLGVMIFSFFLLLFFNILIWTVFNRFTSPLREIIAAIRSSKTEAEIPTIQLSKTTGPNDEFQRLATAFNTLSHRIHEQIENIKAERNEKGAILESLGEGVIAVDGHMTVLYINFTACKMLGIVRKNIINKPFPTEVERGNTLLLTKCKELLIRCQKEVNILTDSLSFGTERKTYIDLIAAPKPQATGAIVVMQDKTSHYRILEMGKDFVANASHELRTPITIIKGYAETLHDVPHISKELLKEITEKIGRNCERMENLVNSLLTLAKIENLSETLFQECDLIPILENCRHTLLLVYPDAQVRIEKPEERVIIDADRGLIELALQNLFDNAAKYSPPPAKIDVHIELEEEEVSIRISDKGRGIPKEDLEHIFERFYRVDKTHSRKLGGAGLGLSIVKTIIDKHNGTIQATSQVDKGTTFTIRLPVSHRN